MKISNNASRIPQSALGVHPDTTCSNKTQGQKFLLHSCLVSDVICSAKAAIWLGCAKFLHGSSTDSFPSSKVGWGLDYITLTEHLLQCLALMNASLTFLEFGKVGHKLQLQMVVPINWIYNDHADCSELHVHQLQHTNCWLEASRWWPLEAYWNRAELPAIWKISSPSRI